VTGNVERFAIASPTAFRDTTMRVPCIEVIDGEVIDREPIEVSGKIRFHPRRTVACKALQVRKLKLVFERHNEAEERTCAIALSRKHR
jgi:hypothetical protein